MRSARAWSPETDERLARKGKGKEAKLSYLANMLMENRNGPIVGVGMRHASGSNALPT